MNERKLIALFILAIPILTLIRIAFVAGHVPVVYKPAPGISAGNGYRARILWPPPGKDSAALHAGNGMGVALDARGDVFYLHRAGFAFRNNRVIPHPVIVHLDGRTGRVKARWGAGLFKSPHGLAVINNEIIITDIMLNRVFRFDPRGRLLGSFGKQYPAGLEMRFRVRNLLPWFPTTNDPEIFARPTDIAPGPNGTLVISDGYRNSRLAFFSRAGRFLRAMGGRGKSPGKFHLPHGLARDASGNLYVADRSNARVQVLTEAGRARAVWDAPELGRPFAVDVNSRGHVYVADGGDVLYKKKRAPRAQIIRLNRRGEIIERWGRYGKAAGEMRVPHDIAADKHGNVFVAELWNNRLQKFERKQ